MTQGCRTTPGDGRSDDERSTAEACAARGSSTPARRAAGQPPGEHDGTGRVRLQFTPSGPRGPGAARRHRLRRRELERHRHRLHLRRARHLQEVQGPDRRRQRAGPRLDARSFTRRASTTAGGWRASPRRPRDLEIDVPPLATRPKAANVGVGRQVILRPAIQKRYVELIEPTLSDQQPDLDRLLAAIDDLELRVDLHALRRLPRGLAAGRLQGHRGRGGRRADRRRAR